MIARLVLLATAAIALSQSAQPRPLQHVGPWKSGDADTVIMRIHSASATPVLFTALVVADHEGRPYQRVHTPLELRLPTATLHALIQVQDGGELSAEILGKSGATVLRSATGNGRTMMLYFGRGSEAGIAMMP